MSCSVSADTFHFYRRRLAQIRLYSELMDNFYGQSHLERDGSEVNPVFIATDLDEEVEIRVKGKQKVTSTL